MSLDLGKTTKEEANAMMIHNITAENIIMCCCRMFFSRACDMARCFGIHCCTPVYST